MLQEYFKRIEDKRQAGKVKHNLDANQRRYENGKKVGRPKKQWFCRIYPLTLTT